MSQTEKKHRQRTEFSSYDTMAQIAHCMCCPFPNECVDCYSTQTWYDKYHGYYKPKQTKVRTDK